MYELTVSGRFAAAHQLRGYKGRCENLHGHNWVVHVTVEAEKLNEIGLAVDFTDLKEALNEVLNRIDHQFLNDLSPFKEENPSSENLARWIGDRLGERLDSNDLRVARVTVWESDDARATHIREP